jgi:hypothetical protein
MLAVVRSLTIALVAMAVAIPSGAAPSAHPSIFVRYQFELSEVLDLLKQAQGQPLDPATPAARWLDEMGWRRWVREHASKPFQLTSEMEKQLVAQDRFLRDTYSYQVGDVVWTPAEQGEQPYGHSQARVNPRGKITRIIKGANETYFVVEVGVDNAARGGMRTIQGRYYDGSTGPILDYGPNFDIQKKTYVYSLSEIERYNGAFRSQSVGSDTGATVDYVKDAKWLRKLDAFKDKVLAKGLEIDFTAPAAEIYARQRRLIIELFNHFKMNRNAPSGAPLLGDVAEGGGVCFTQACVLSHGVHAVGEPYGIKAMNINGSTVNPSGGHGFTRLTIRGPEEVHVYDLVKDAQTGQVKYRGLEIRSNTMNFISDPGWADYGKTPEFFADMPVETAINPIPVDANRAIHDLIQGKSFEEVVVKYGGKGPMVGNLAELKGELFAGTRQVEFLAPRGQIAEAGALERQLTGELTAMLDEAKVLKGGAEHLRGLKSRILTEVVESRVGRLAVPGVTADGLRVLLTEYLFRAVR